jgi:hypothetical protein
MHRRRHHLAKVHLERAGLVKVPSGMFPSLLLVLSRLVHLVSLLHLLINHLRSLVGSELSHLLGLHLDLQRLRNPYPVNVLLSLQHLLTQLQPLLVGHPS